MNDVVIAGIGMVPVGEHWQSSLRELAGQAIRAAIKDAGGLEPQAMYVGNLLASVAEGQANLGSLLATQVGLDGIEGVTVEASEASGAAAMRMAFLSVASGFTDAALVIGVEKCTDMVDRELENALSETTHYDYEAAQGATPTTLAALLMQRYFHEYNLAADALSSFPLLAHHNAMNNEGAMFHRELDVKAYGRAGMLSAPLSLLDKAPYGDGAAALLLTRPEHVPAGLGHVVVKVAASSVVIDTLALHDRRDILGFDAAGLSSGRACKQAGISLSDIDLFELHDAFSIYAALSLEAAGFARRGEGWKLGQSGELELNGKLPVSTMGGLKGRGNPLGATGAYQLVEAALQLRGEAGACQVKDARRALVQSLGGPASTAITHVLERL